jgi:hypothetical protein
MADYRVFGAVDDTLRALLWSQMQFDSEIVSIVTSEQQISFEPPFKLVVDTDPPEDSLSVFLYRVVEDGDMKNQQLRRINGSQLRYPPLALNLYYLITPLTNTTDNDHRLLSKAMHTFYDNAIIRGSQLQGVLSNTAEELRVILNPMSLEDMAKLWSAFMRPLRLSVSYEIKVVFIDSERETAGEQVRRKRLEFSQLPG